uniref:Uncharacterized protein n=1 Tax=Strigamia maritima TaxID=126957 RepID=T1J3A8_STRMM
MCIISTLYLTRAQLMTLTLPGNLLIVFILIFLFLFKIDEGGYCKLRAEFICSVHKYCFLRKHFTTNGKLGYFWNFILDNDQQTRKYSPDLAENGEVGNGDHNSSVSAAILKKTLACIVSASFSDIEERDMIALETLLHSHHPIIGTEKPTDWITVLQELQLDPAQYLSKNIDTILH